jgi:hypothetical protein
VVHLLSGCSEVIELAAWFNQVVLPTYFVFLSWFVRDIDTVFDHTAMLVAGEGVAGGPPIIV